MKALLKTHKGYRQIEKYMEENPQGLRQGMERGSAKQQVQMALTMQAIAEEKAGVHNHVPSLAETIIHQKWNDLERHGENTYPFSAKQLDVIFRDFIG